MAAAYIILVYALISIYMVFAVRQYGRWLRDNYADLEHKEVWQSLALVFFAIYGLYTSNMGALSREYLSQVLTVAIVAFLVWRAETLEELEADGNDYRRYVAGRATSRALPCCGPS